MRACYAEAIADIRWAKERASTTMQISVATSIGLVLLSGELAAVPSRLLSGLAAAQAVVALFLIGDLAHFAWKSRTWVAACLEGVIGAYGARRNKLRTHIGYAVAQSCAALAAAYLAVRVLWPS